MYTRFRDLHILSPTIEQYIINTSGAWAVACYNDLYTHARTRDVKLIYPIIEFYSTNQ